MTGITDHQIMAGLKLQIREILSDLFHFVLKNKAGYQTGCLCKTPERKAVTDIACVFRKCRIGDTFWLCPEYTDNFCAGV